MRIGCSFVDAPFGGMLCVLSACQFKTFVFPLCLKLDWSQCRDEKDLGTSG